MARRFGRSLLDLVGKKHPTVTACVPLVAPHKRKLVPYMTYISTGKDTCKGVAQIYGVPAKVIELHNTNNIGRCDDRLVPKGTTIKIPTRTTRKHQINHTKSKLNVIDEGDEEEEVEFKEGKITEEEARKLEKMLQELKNSKV
jgi:hypothetical protein